MINKYVFVFQKPIDKTNVQRAELISLIELLYPQSVIHFKRPEDLLNNKGIYFENCFSFSDGQNIKLLNDENIVVSFLFQSAIIITSIEINQIEIIRRSGYIQSCGDLLFLMKWEDLNVNNIVTLTSVFISHNKKNYNLEFYTNSENENIEIKLPNLLIDDSRYHIGKKSIKVAMNDIKNKIELHATKLSLNTIEGSIFIYKDRGKIVDASPLSKLYSDRNVVEYGISYLSDYKKDNPIHYLDDLKESKPYWAGIFTTPHNLMNAMLNLAKVKENSVVVDPFSHTGTCIIESSQIGCEIKAYDIHEIQGAEDNYTFLCEGSKNFNEIVIKLESLLDNKELNEQFQLYVEESIDTNPQGLPEIKPEATIDILISKYASNKYNLSNIENRLYFYILRRYEMELRRGADLIVDSAKELVKHYIYNSNKEKKIRPGYKLYGKQFQLFEQAYNNSGFPLVNLDNGFLKANKQICFEDEKYKTNRIGYISKSKGLSKASFDTKDILKDDYGISDGSIDAVVTDPPYGYGEGLSSDKVRNIYTKLFEKSFKWLKDGGSLVFCALDKVKTGRKEDLLFTEDILNIASVIAKKNNIKFVINNIIVNSEISPNILYWKSNYALNRTIISLNIKKN